MYVHEVPHGWWCNARTYPTRCPWCGADVFYFSCDCGSKVFFDSLGWPWPIHDCVNNILREVEIKIAEEYARRVAERQERLCRGPEIPIRARRPQKGEKFEGVGVVREILPTVDMFKKFRLPPNNRFATELLGLLACGEYAQVTIHINDLSSEELFSYTLLVKTGVLERSGAQVGDLVRFSVVGHGIPGLQAYYWLCISMTLVCPALEAD